MAQTSPQEITQLLRAWSLGDPSALDRLAPLVHQKLRQIAHGYLRREHSGHILQSTALMHEAFVRLLKSPPADWQDRGHFYATMARAMRHILVDLARAHQDRIQLKDRNRAPEECIVI